MKKSFLNLRKLGLIVVAASTMAMYSCGEAEEHTEDAAAAVENAVEEGTEAIEEAVDNATEEMKCEAGKCDTGAATEEMKCEAGKCEHGTATE